MVVADFAFFPIQLRPEMGRRRLYMRAPFPTPVEDGLLIARDEPLTVDGVMTSLYDRELLPFVGGQPLTLRVEVQGACRISLIHRQAVEKEAKREAKKEAKKEAQEEAEEEYGSAISARAIRTGNGDDCEGEIQTFDLDFKLMNSEQSFGRWFFKVEPLRSDVKLRSAAWLIRSAEVSQVVPAFVICTFKRERQVTANVKLLTEVLSPVPSPPPTEASSLLQRDPPASADTSDYGIFVVDNAGSLPETAFSSAHVHLIRQRNVGGAGGFGRGIYEAIEAGRFTHIILLDDDADVDSISIVRMMNLLRLNDDPNLFVGGIQFDTYSPCQLADAGTYWTPERFERPISRLAPCDMGSEEGRDGLARSYNANFNGWWLFGGSVEGFRAFGMPLPCFVHLDDVEFGVRVQLNGGRTVTVPGIAVWHEPFYAKVEGWFAYYNIRNELIRLSAQAPLALAHITNSSAAIIEKRSKKRLASTSRQLHRRFRDFVNAYQYGSAMLLAKAVEDFVSGPEVLLDRDAEALHFEVMAAYKEANSNYGTSRTLPPAFIPEPPSRRHKLYRIAQIYSRNGNRSAVPGGGAQANRITMFQNRRDINWKAMRARQAWGYPDPGSSTYHIYKFDRDAYAAVNARFREAIKKFNDRAGEAQSNWSDAYPEMISHDFWRKLVKTF
ncbi:glycosyltransferase [Novosphingobium sp. RD2P27]|uniref:Glycosyltransferase n=1 Tax=Novosphingobium kalidii TaxID=3230299 RepID=A0ABV2D580_9SPHN